MARSFPFAQVVKILMLITCAVAILLSKDACGLAVTNLFNTVAPPVAADGGARSPPPVTRP
jgi:hypothetical protein